MNKGFYLMFYILCVLAGLAGFVADTWLNLEFVGFKNTGPAITIVVITVCSAIALSAATVAIKFKKYFLSLMCFVGLVSSFFWHVPITLSRIAATMDHKSVLHDNHENKRKLLDRSYQETKKVREEESKKGGCKDNCQKLMLKEEAILKEMGDLGTSSKEDAAAKRIAFVTSIPPETIEMVVPIFAVVALMCLMNGLLALGIYGLLDKKYKEEKHVINPNQVLNIRNDDMRRPNVVKGSENDPFVALVRESGAMSISDIASKTGKSLPYVSVYVSDLQRRGIFSKTKEGRKTYIDLIKK